MKKILALLLAVSMVFALAACGNNDGAKKEDAPTGVKMNLETLPTSGIDYVLKTEFYYPENSGITVEYNETDCIALADEGNEYIMMLWNNVNKVDSKKRKNYTDINIASFWLGVRPLLCE